MESTSSKTRYPFAEEMASRVSMRNRVTFGVKISQNSSNRSASFAWSGPGAGGGADRGEPANVALLTPYQRAVLGVPPPLSEEK